MSDYLRTSDANAMEEPVSIRPTPVSLLGEAASPTPKEPEPTPFLKVQQKRLTADADGVWAQLVDRLRDVSTLEYLGLASTQRVAWSVLMYDAMVRAEGHREYFRVFGLARAAEARQALRDLGAHAQHRLLAEAIQRDLSHFDDYETSVAARGWSSTPLGPRPDYTDLDIPYCLQAEEVRTRLESYVWMHMTDFIEVEGAA